VSRSGGLGIAIHPSSGNLVGAATGSLEPRIRLAPRDAAAFEGQAALVLVVGHDDLLLHASGDARACFAGAHGDPIGRPVSELVPQPIPDGGSVLLDVCERASEPGAARRVLEGRAYAAPPPSANRVLVFHDVTTRTRDLVVLLENERRFSRVATASLDVVTETSGRGTITYVSGACESVLGYAPEELVGSSPLDLCHPDDLPRVRRELAATRGSTEPFRMAAHRLRHKQGHWVAVDATAVRYVRPDGEERVIGVACDIGERLRAERERDELHERMLRSQKLESLGVLAGGIAHDFNNLLTPIVGNAGLLLADLPERSPSRRWAEAILNAGHRATALTTQMLTYAGQTERRIEPLDVSALIDDVSLLLETTASRASRVHLELARGLPPVHGCPGQITQIVMNLVANSSEALGEDGGRIDIRTRRVRADRARLDLCYLGDARPEGDYVEISVSDDGEGLPPEVLEQVFDPFFTTRVPGRGLGLAVVLGAAQAHDGAIQIESSAAGTCFRVLLPICNGHAAGAERLARKQAKGRAPSRSGFMLVVDDDQAAREVSVTVLERAGFEVLQAGSGPQAIALFRRHARDIAGVMLDATMPGMSGAHVFDSLRQIDPDARIVLVSGHAKDGATQALRAGGLTGFLHKPYEPDQLLDAVQRLLGQL